MKDRKRSWSKPQSKKRPVSKRIETFSSAFPIGVGPQSNQIFDIERVFIEIFWLIHIEEIKGRINSWEMINSGCYYHRRREPKRLGVPP